MLASTHHATAKRHLNTDSPRTDFAGKAAAVSNTRTGLLAFSSEHPFRSECLAFAVGTQH